MVNAPLRILHVIDTLEVGGAQRHLLSLTEALRSRGHHCRIATSGNARMASSGEMDIFSLTRESISHRLPFRFTMRLLRLLAEQEVDIVHAHLHASAVAAAVATIAHRIPLVVTHHSDGAWQHPYHQILGHWASACAHTSITVARSLAAEGATSDPTSVLIPNGVPLDARDPTDREHVREELGIPPHAFVVVFIGRFVADKDPLLFVEMAAHVAEADETARFLMVGDGPLRREIEERASHRGIAPRFSFTGLRRDTTRLYHAADVVVVPSRRDACPLVPLEAMAAGRPVVGTAVGDIPEQIVDGTTGYVVPPGDGASLAAAVLTLAAPSRRRQFGQAGREHVAERFSVDRMVDRTLAVYEQAVRRPEPASRSITRYLRAHSGSGVDTHRL
jgi:glycosyltransferase involved in cell wall biosynthesis